MRVCVRPLGTLSDNAELNVSSVLHRAVAAYLDLEPESLPVEKVRLVRKSIDARPPRRRGKAAASHSKDERDVCWSHVVDVELSPAQAKRIKAIPGRIVPADKERITADVPATLASSPSSVIVVGAGPCGLFAALTLARAGHRVTLVERGKPVEERGRSIGALVKRGVIDSESNFCYGEGGAGTWSDGKLTTRIGRNSADVREVLETLVHFGAPSRILLDGKPHLGTDNLVRLLKNFRGELLRLGSEIKWDSRVDHLVMDGEAEAGAEAGANAEEAEVATGGSGAALGGGRLVRGVKLASGETLLADAVVLAAGHSARELYIELIARGAKLVPKDFAVGFRIEHPQSMINRAQYGEMSGYCQEGGRGELPPASYRLATTVYPENGNGGGDDGNDGNDGNAGRVASKARSKRRGKGSSGRGGRPAKDQDNKTGGRGIYSFCMCPGGQIVPTSIVPDRLCINGMSYSNRGSKWANSAVVVSVGSEYGDYKGLDGGEADGSEADGGETGDGHGGPRELAGLRFQEAMEARAAVMGGEGLICPVQRVSDFLEGRMSQEPLPASSYRRGIKSAPLHELYPPPITEALRTALRRWGRTMEGFDGDEALLHGVETRTSAPVQIKRLADSCEAVGLEGLFPAGEGAGYAGGIVSAAVDGLRVAKALLRCERLEAKPCNGDEAEGSLS